MNGRRRIGAYMTVGLAVLIGVALLSTVPARAGSVVQATPAAPSAPSAVQATGVNTGINVSWATPYSGGAATITKYVVTASSTMGTGTCTVLPPSGNACTVETIANGTPLANGTQYQVTVKATSSAGFNSVPSPVVLATPSPTQNCQVIGPDANLQGCNLVNANLAGDLTNANLTGANLSGASLNGVTLTGAVLTGADFGSGSGVASLTNVGSGSTVDATPTNLPPSWSLIGGYLVGPEANLSSANFANANLTGANLSYANLSHATLTGATLTGATLTGVSSGSIVGTPALLPSGWAVIGAYLVGPGADLNGANLSGSGATNAQLGAASWTSVDLDGSNLSGLDFTGLNLTGANLSYANLTGVTLTDANLTNAILLQATITNAILTGATLTGVSSGSIQETPLGSVPLPANWSLTASGYLIGPGANLDAANLNGVTLANADLVGANLSDAVLTGTNLTGTNLTGATLVGVSSGSIIVNPGGSPPTLPVDVGDVGVGASPSNVWLLVNGYLVGYGADLAGASLANQNFVLAGNNENLGEADLQGANLSGDVLGTSGEHVNLGAANLIGANLSNTSANFVNFGGANLTDANLNTAVLPSAILTNVISGGITGTPTTLPAGWTLVNGVLIPPGTTTNSYSLVASPTSQTVTAGGTANSTIVTTTTSGTAQTVALTSSGAPAGVTVSFTSPSVSSGGTDPMTVTTSSLTPSGSYPITVTGTAPSGTETATFTVTVNAAVTSSPALVQSATATESAASLSLQATFPRATTAGDLLVLTASEYTGSTNQLTVSDSAGDVWTKITSATNYVAGHNSYGAMWYLADAPSVASVTVSTKTASFVSFEVQEFSGVAATNPLDASTGSSNTGTTASSGTATPSTSGDLAVGFVAGHGNAEAITVPATPFTTQPQLATTGSIATLVTGNEVVNGTSSQSFGGTFKTAMYWAAGIALFDPASSAAPADVTPRIAHDQVAKAASASAPIGITPSATGYVDSAEPTLNFGGAPALDISSSEFATYLKFDTDQIPQGATIDSATLYVTPDSAPSGANAGYVQLHLPGVATALPDAWSQGTLTYADQPTWNLTSADSTEGAVAIAGVQEQFNVTGDITEGGNTNFALDFSSSTPATLYGASAGSSAPMLAVTYTVSEAASAGTFDSSTASTTGYAGVNPLSFSLSSYQAFLTFPTASLGSGVSLQSASLTVTPVAASAAGIVTVFSTPPFTASAVDTDPPPVKGALAGTGTTPLTCSPMCATNTISLNTSTSGLFAPGKDTNLELGVLTGGTLDKIDNQAQGANAPSLQLTLQVIPAATPPAGGNLCGSDEGQAPTTKKVMIIWEENKSWIDQGEGTAEMPAVDGDSQDAPYINSLASSCAVVSNNRLAGEAGYQSYDHGSLGNYMGVATGDLSAYEAAPWSADCIANPVTAANAVGCTTNEPSIFSQGASWKGYAESMDTGCENHDGGGTFSSATSKGSAPVQYYLNRHNPEVEFTNLDGCSTSDVAFSPNDAEPGNPLYNDVMSGSLPTISTVTPNSLDDGHYSPGTSDAGANNQLENQDSDAWLQTWLPIITSGSDYQSGNLTILIMWDEGYGGNPSAGTYTPSNPPLFIISPYVTPGETDTNGAVYSAASVTRAVEEIAGTPLLRSAGAAPDLRSAFNF